MRKFLLHCVALIKTKIVSKFQEIISTRSDSTGILIFKHLTKTWPWYLHHHFLGLRHNRKDLCDWPEIFFKICLNGRNLKSKTCNRLGNVVWTQFWKNLEGGHIDPLVLIGLTRTLINIVVVYKKPFRKFET